jgi:hypothetical protein
LLSRMTFRYLPVLKSISLNFSRNLGTCVSLNVNL